MKVTMSHGSGGKATSDLISSIFYKNFQNSILSQMEDSAIVSGSGTLAVTTDSFVVTPLFFPGGDIGRLSICGTVNDLLMSGATPKYLTCGFIIEEGVPFNTLDKIAVSMKKTAEEAGVLLVAGDTKVVEGNGGLYINTSGVGFVPNGLSLGAINCKPGDAVLISGTLGEHHAAILSARMGIENSILSDCAPLVEMVSTLLNKQVRIKAMRDVTRGGLATILNEFSHASHCQIILRENTIPVSESVQSFCNILGLDPLYMGNEGKMVLVVDAHDAEKALACLRESKYGEHASIIGHIQQGGPTVLLQTKLGGIRTIPELYGEGLPRIC